jgi:hypothetical protein
MLDPSEWTVLKEYGDTEPGPDGYVLRVQLVETPYGSHRVRISLRRNDRTIKHIDTREPAMQRLWPILRAAVSEEGQD